MKAAYPIILTQGAENIVVYVPDFEINTQGADYADAMEMARDAIGLMGIDMEDDGEQLPAAHHGGGPQGSRRRPGHAGGCGLCGISPEKRNENRAAECVSAFVAGRRGPGSGCECFGGAFQGAEEGTADL